MADDGETNESRTAFFYIQKYYQGTNDDEIAHNKK